MPSKFYAVSISPPGTLARIRKISCLDNPASLQRDRKMESSLSNKFNGVSNSET